MASRSWNRVELIGNLTRDPELRFTPNGAAVCTFGLATNRSFVSDGERREEVDFHRLVSWNKLAELCNQLLKKGHKVFISGRLQSRSWEGQDGQKRDVTEVVIEDMILLTPKGSGSVAASSEDVNIEDLPEEQAVAKSDLAVAAEQPLPDVEDVKKPVKKEKSAPDIQADEKVEEADLPF